MKKQGNHSQLKHQENSPEGTNNETNLFSLIDTEFTEKVMKILKELRKAIDRNADYCKKTKKQTRNYKEEPRKIRKFICRDKS